MRRLTTADRREYEQGLRAGRQIAARTDARTRKVIRQEYLAMARYSWDRPYLVGLARGLGR